MQVWKWRFSSALFALFDAETTYQISFTSYLLRSVQYKFIGGGWEESMAIVGEVIAVLGLYRHSFFKGLHLIFNKMSLRALIEVVVHLESFRNIDLFY